MAAIIATAEPYYEGNNFVSYLGQLRVRHMDTRHRLISLYQSIIYMIMDLIDPKIPPIVSIEASSCNGGQELRAIFRVRK